MPDDIEWITPPGSVDEQCMLCGNRTGNKLIMRARHYDAKAGMLDLARCGSCGSAWFPDAKTIIRGYPAVDRMVNQPNFVYTIYHYLELVGGLDWKISLLEKLPYQKFSSVLEVGCNAGTMLDYCRTQWNADRVIGLEPSAYGVVGSQLLEIPIICKYMHEAHEIKVMRFDCIFATEVIEHVADPIEFLRTIKSFLSPGGIVLITTPAAECLTPSTPPGELRAALSAGAHYFLASNSRLRELASSVGFKWCDMTRFGMSHVAIMADAPVELAKSVDVPKRLHEYYQKRQRDQFANARVRLGFLIQAYVSHSSLYRREPAASSAIPDLLRELMNIEIDKPEALVAGALTCRAMQDFGRLMPLSLPYYLFWRAHHIQRETERAADYLALSRLLCLACLRADFLNFWIYSMLVNRIDAKVANGGLVSGRWMLEMTELERGIPQFEAIVAQGQNSGGRANVLRRFARWVRRSVRG